MSTTFAVIIKDNNLSEEYDDVNSEFIEVAFRSNSWSWRHPLAKFLPGKTKVFPLDNSAQGIYIIQDIIDDFDK